MMYGHKWKRQPIFKGLNFICPSLFYKEVSYSKYFGPVFEKADNGE